MLAPAAASSLDKPNAIAAQNLFSSSRPATAGRPGEGNGALGERSERRRFNLVIVTPHEALRRLLESAPMTQGAEDGKIPLLDIGTIDRIRRGLIAVRPGIARISGADVHFDDGARAPFDVIIQATGYRPSLRALLPDHQDVLDRSGAPIVCGRPTRHPGLFFCGHIAVATGQLREIGLEAERIATTIRAGASREFD